MFVRFGTQLRHLLEICEAGVALSYRDAGINYIPRYTPVLRALLAQEPLTVGGIAAAARMTQPAVTQTVALMVQDGLLMAKRGTDDARQRLIRLTRKARTMVPTIQSCWDETAAAHWAFEDEIGVPLSQYLDVAIAALEKRSMAARIADARTVEKLKAEEAS